jgi:hypothetical protein
MNEKLKVVALWIIAVLLGFHLVVYAAQRRYQYLGEGTSGRQVRVDNWTGKVQILVGEKRWYTDPN